MKIYILNTGYLETKKKYVVASGNSAAFDDNEILKLPVMAVLIDHPDGKILYDLGSNPKAMEGYWPEHLREAYPLFQTDTQRLENQLALCHTTPDEIKTVVLSHFHLDHCGNLNLFPDASVYAPKDDFIFAQCLVRQDINPATHGGYIKADLDVPVKKYYLIDKDMELFNGIDIISLPGHTPDLLGMMVHTKNSGTIIFPQDCVYNEEIYGPPAKLSGLLYNKQDFLNSIEKVRDLQQKHNAMVVFAHDEKFFQTLKKAPLYYD